MVVELWKDGHSSIRPGGKVMRQELSGSRTMLLGALALALAATLGAQTTSSTKAPADSSPSARRAP